MPKIENKIEIMENKEVVLDGVESIKEFGVDRITLKLRKYSVQVIGDEIIVSEFTNGLAVLRGRIFSVNFLYD